MKHQPGSLMRMMLMAMIAVAWGDRGQAQTVRTLETSMDTSSTIVIGRLEQYLAEPEPMDRMVEKQSAKNQALSGNPAAVVMMTTQVRGTYVFTILKTLKGTAPQTLVVRWGRITGGSILDRGGGMRLTGTYLLMLQSQGDDHFSPVGPAPMPVGDDAGVADVGNSSAGDVVVKLLVDQMADASLRESAVNLLKDSTNPLALAALRPYADDPNDTLRAAALNCMAVNQDVTAIPKIAGWKFNKPGMSGNGNLSLLSKYKTAEAIPYLNELLVDQRSHFIRLNATQALRQLPLEKSTIPFWMKALHDPEEDQVVVYGAYNSLHKLVPSLGAPGNVMQFRANRAAEIKILDDWWAAEQTRPTTQE